MVNELVMDEAYFKQLVEDLGGRKWLKSVIEESDAAREARLRLNRERSDLLKTYPHKWVAFGRDGVLTVAASPEELFESLEACGKREVFFITDHLDPDPPLSFF